MDRKEFIINASLAVFAVSISNCKKEEEKSPEVEVITPVEACKTTSDILGPFYRAGAPDRYDLTFAGLAGNVIELSGKVFKQDCTTPIENVLVEVWHCDTGGAYDNSSAAFLHRGVRNTNVSGEYSFKTILPGKYKNGTLYRPSHIHFKVSHPDSEDLVSQIYFKNDPNIPEDPWAGTPNAEKRILPITLEDVNGNLAIQFDISLKDIG
jgi:catechol 1,2-dioxygenase